MAHSPLQRFVYKKHTLFFVEEAPPKGVLYHPSHDFVSAAIKSSQHIHSIFSHDRHHLAKVSENNADEIERKPNLNGVK